MGYPTKIQLISRKKGQQWYVNFPNALAQAMNFEKGETVEWTVLSTTCLQMERKSSHKNATAKPANK
jgi:antitoxin component of MazEF toxin-antitoxin module